MLTLAGISHPSDDLETLVLVLGAVALVIYIVFALAARWR